MERTECLDRKFLKTRKEKLALPDINKLMDCYEKDYGNFIFLNAIPRDSFKKEVAEIYVKEMDAKKLYKQGKRRFAVIFNTDPSYKKGRHWVAVFVTANNRRIDVEYYDSVGDPPMASIVKFIERYFIDPLDEKGGKFVTLKSNKIVHQGPKDEINCGLYSLYFIIKRLQGETFDQVNKNIKEEDIIKFREKITRIK